MTIFAKPEVGEYASTGVWSNLGGTAGEWLSAAAPSTPSENAQITTIVTADSTQPRIRYTADGHYELRLPGEAYNRLFPDRRLTDPTTDNTQFQVEHSGFLTISGARSSGYLYSELGSWWRPDLDWGFTADFGVFAFGMPTPAGGVPTTGLARYDGVVAGITDAKTFDWASNSYLLLPAGGSVSLSFDFGRGALAGQMSLSVNGGMNPIDVGTFAFTQTVFSPGSTTYSGKFDTNLAGFNFFAGLFTGPGAEETIGSWAVPFTLNNKDQQAIGAWIAKSAN